jgi:hypothetical protein
MTTNSLASNHDLSDYAAGIVAQIYLNAALPLSLKGGAAQ